MKGMKVNTQHDSYEKYAANLKGSTHYSSAKMKSTPNHVKSMGAHLRLLLRDSIAEKQKIGQ
jgi:hypothetical protein